jgi:hypothetical protein
MRSADETRSPRRLRDVLVDDQPASIPVLINDRRQGEEVVAVLSFIF